MKDLIDRLTDKIGPGHMSSTAYDTAWGARLGELDCDLSGQALAWLTEHQLPDGSWGAQAPFYYHDRVICTLAAMIALSQSDRRGFGKVQFEKGQQALERLLSGATAGLRADPHGETIGFEMIAPTLVTEAEQLGLIPPQREGVLGGLSKKRSKKLAYLENKMINRHVTMAFSAEMVGAHEKHMLDAENLQECNGSVGVSPSATAFFATYVRRGDETSLNYLRNAKQADGGMPNVAPFDVFEIAWSLWNLGLIPGSDLRAQLQPHIDFLSNAWEPRRGVGYTTKSSVKDCDDSAITYSALLRFGVEKDLDTLLAYEEEDRFRCFALEVNASISANIHVLGALGQSGFTRANSSVQKIVRFLHTTKGQKPYWVDKWHISPYYTTAHAVIACIDFAKEMAEDSVQWILRTQNIDGSWGSCVPTAEETAYALQALWIWNEKVAKIPKGALQHGARWLKEHMDAPYPPLWIGKCLYSPECVIRSAIISALTLVL